MFSIRDELFDFAHSGRIDFQHQAYRLLRNSMNGFIRYAHRLTFFQAFVTIVRWSITEQVHPLTWHLKWTEALGSLPLDVQSELREFHDRAMDAVAMHLLLGSFLLMVFLPMAVLHRLISGAWTSLRLVFRDATELLITRFLNPKILEEEATRA